MKIIKIFKLDKLTIPIRYIGLLTAALYGVCMFIYPWISGSGDWAYVQNVWERWQGINVGVLALVSSIIAFRISKFNAEKQREREFLASKAFLPEALSELSSYFEESATVLKAAWGSGWKGVSQLESPPVPQVYKQVFANCIRHATPEVGDYLAKILVWLQIHDSRLREYIGHRQVLDNINLERHNLLSNLYRLGELQALTNNIFDFSRNMDVFNSTPLGWNEFRAAFRNLDIQIDEFVTDEEISLESYVKNKLRCND